MKCYSATECQHRNITFGWYGRSVQELFFLIGFLIPALFILYSNVLDSPFLFDDINNIEQNRTIHITNLSLSSLKKTTDGSRPIAMLSFAANYYLHGLSPFGFRVTNLLLHISTAILLYCILCSTVVIMLFEDDNMRKFRWVPLVSSILWAVHPLQIQSVTYIVQRMNILAGLFLLLSLLLYIRARLSNSVPRKIVFCIFCIFSGLLAIGSKPNVAVLPILIILYEWIFFQKGSWRWLLIRSPMLLLCSLFIVGAIAYYLMDSHPVAMLTSWYVEKNFTATQRVITEFRVVILYLSLLFFPHPSRLNLDHDILLSTSLFAPLSTVLSLITIVGLLVTSILSVRKIPLFSFGLFWFFINLSIESTVIPLDLIFEHRNYIPSMLLIAGTVFLTGCFIKKNVKRVLVVVIFILLSLWTYQRNGAWESGVTIWQDSVNKSPDKSRPHGILAYYLTKEGHFKKALYHYQQAIRLDSENADFRNNIGVLCVKTGDIPAALNYYKSALDIRPEHKEAHNNIGMALSMLGKPEKAVVHYKKALNIDKYYLEAYINMANTLAAIGDLQGALQYYKSAAELDSEDIDIYYNMSVFFLKTDRFAEAEQALEKVVAEEKEFKGAYNNLGVAREHLGKIKAAEESYQQALKIDPNFIDAQQNLERLQRRL